MKKPPKEVLKKLTEKPYKFFEGVDYQKIMSLEIPAIRIDTRDEQSLLNDQAYHRKNLVNKQKSAAHQGDNGNDDEESLLDDTNANIVFVCGLIIDIEAISKQQILKLRKSMPKKEYRQLKNRKSARECRKRRKSERFGMIEELEMLRADKKRLEEQVKQLKA